MRFWTDLPARIGVASMLLAMVGCGGEEAAPDYQPELLAEPTSTQAEIDAREERRESLEEVPPTWIAVARGHVTELVAHEEPDGPMQPLAFAVPNPHQFGSAMTLMVTEGEPKDAWVKVQLPSKPNGQEGWIRSSDYRFSSTKIRAEVDLSETSVVVYDGNQIIAQSKAVVGSSATPTPLGTYFVTAKKQNNEDYLGPWALALSSFSEVHETFAGGLPVIAIHGTNRPEQVGEARSNGCIRIPNDIVTKLAETVPLGAPVSIMA